MMILIQMNYEFHTLKPMPLSTVRCPLSAVRCLLSPVPCPLPLKIHPEGISCLSFHPDPLSNLLILNSILQAAPSFPSSLTTSASC